VVGFDPVVRVLTRIVERRGSELVDGECQRVRLVSEDLDRLAVVSERPGKEPPSRAGVTSW